MKLPGIQYETPVQSLGRENVRGPMAVARAEAATAEKKASVAGKVAGNITAIGRIHQGTAREIAGAQRADINRSQEFSRNMLRMVSAGAGLTVDIIKADAMRDFAEFKRAAEITKNGMAGPDAPSSMEVLRDKNDPTMGMKTVSIAKELPSSFSKAMSDMKESFLKEANPWAAGMLGEQMDGYISEAELDVHKMSIAKQKDFTGGQGLELMNEAVLNQDWTTARQLHSEFRSMYSGAKNAQIAGMLDNAQKQTELENLSFDTANNIINTNSGFAAQMKSAEKIKNKAVRQGVIQIVQRQENTRAYAETKGKEFRKAQVESHILEQIKNVEPDKWVANEMMNSKELLAFETLRQKTVAGVEVKTQPVPYMKLSTMLATDPQAFARVNLMEYAHQIGASDLRTFIDSRSDILAGKTPKAVAHMKLTDQSLKRNLPEGFAKENQEKYAAIFEVVQKEMSLYEEESGRKMTDVEQTNTINQVVGEYTKKNPWYHADKTFKITEDIPIEEINPLSDYLRGTDQAVSTKNLMLAKDQFDEYRPDYESMYESMGIDADEDQLMEMFEVDTFLREIISFEDKDITTKSRKAYYGDYLGQVPAINAVLESRNMPQTTSNRMKFYTIGRRKRGLR